MFTSSRTGSFPSAYLNCQHHEEANSSEMRATWTPALRHPDGGSHDIAKWQRSAAAHAASSALSSPTSDHIHGLWRCHKHSHAVNNGVSFAGRSRPLLPICSLYFKQARARHLSCSLPLPGLAMTVFIPFRLFFRTQTQQSSNPGETSCQGFSRQLTSLPTHHLAL